MALPAAIQAALARGIAAYLREAPPTDVPSKLRRFAGWRDQALKPHRAQLIAGLDDEGFRNKILDWLDDSSPLKAEEARLLAIAAERSDNWAERLAGAAPKAPTKRAKSDSEKLQAELERERARTAKLKDELRAQKEEARGAATASKSRVGELTSEVRDLRAALRQRESELKTVMGERDRARQAIEKEKRSLRREAERAAKAKDAAEERLAASKREVAELKRRILTLEDRLADEKMKRARARDAAKARRATPSGPRRPLPAPKGLLADAPQTLSAWLASDGVSLIVDGYNVGKATAGFPGLELEAMRKRLVDEVAKLARRHGIEATIVFDGAEVGPGTRRLRRPPVKIEFSPPDVIADDVIVARVEAAPPGPLVVATNDKGLQERVAALGATIATSDQLLALMSGRKVVVSPR
jgi:predicted RNA-binding protein with PIN domain